MSETVVKIEDAVDLLDVMYRLINSPNGRVVIDCSDYLDSENLLTQARQIVSKKSLNAEFC